MGDNLTLLQESVMLRNRAVKQYNQCNFGGFNKSTQGRAFQIDAVNDMKKSSLYEKVGKMSVEETKVELKKLHSQYSQASGHGIFTVIFGGKSEQDLINEKCDVYTRRLKELRNN